MADYFTHFSCLIDVGTPEKAVQAIELFLRLRNEDYASEEPRFAGFDLSIQDDPQSSLLWIRDDGSGDVEAVISFVLRLAADLDLTGLWGFEYANTCSRARIGAFGGGAHVIDLGARTTIGWTNTNEWLAAALNGENAHA